MQTAEGHRSTVPPPVESPPVTVTPQTASAGADDSRGSLGQPSATALVVGSIIGTGVFTMPAVMAGAGTSSLVTLGVITIGAVLLGALFGQLTKRVPNSDGGLYAYARHEFGDFAGYVIAWCYWVQCWAGNAAIVASWVLYVESFLSLKDPSSLTSFGIAMTGLWIPAIINLAGVRNVAWFQNLTVVLKFLPLAIIAVIGWFWVKSANFGPFNATGSSLYSGIGIAAGVALFSFIGVEASSIVAAKVRNPRRNVGRAAVYGTAACGVLYLLVTAVVMGLVPHDALVGNGAPFVPAFQAILGNAGWVGKMIAGTAVVSGIGALNGWTLLSAEMPMAAAKDGLFQQSFAKVDRRGTPWFGILVSTGLASLLMAWSYSGSTGLKVFTYLVALSVVTVAIPYFVSACAQFAFLVSRRRRVQGWALTRDLAITITGLLFSLWVTFAAGFQAVYQAILIVMIGLPLYGFLKARKERLGLVPEPIDQFDDVPAAAQGASS